MTGGNRRANSTALLRDFPDRGQWNVVSTIVKNDAKWSNRKPHTNSRGRHRKGVFNGCAGVRAGALQTAPGIFHVVVSQGLRTTPLHPHVFECCVRDERIEPTVCTGMRDTLAFESCPYRQAEKLVAGQFDRSCRVLFGEP